MDSSEIKVKKKARRKKKSIQASTVANKIVCSSPENNCTPSATPVASCKPIVDKLRTGVTYKGIVIESYEHRFIVLVENHFRVLVHSARYLPLANQRDVPIRCVLADGDEVSLTAVKNYNNMSRYDEEWIAEKCWVDQSSVHRSQKSDVVECTSILMERVTLVRASLLHLGSAPNVIVALSSSIFLHGFPVDGVNLNDIFKIGDELNYEIDTSKPFRANEVFAKKAWYGSSQNDSCASTDKLLEFCISRHIRKEILISLSNQQKGKTKYNGTPSNTEYLDDDGFHLDLEYIKPLVHNTQSEKRTENKDKYVLPDLRRNEQYASTDDLTAQKQISKSKKTYTLPVNEIQLNNRFDILSAHIDTNISETCDVIDVATQTYSTGDIFCNPDTNSFSFSWY